MINKIKTHFQSHTSATYFGETDRIRGQQPGSPVKYTMLSESIPADMTTDDEKTPVVDANDVTTPAKSTGKSQGFGFRALLQKVEIDLLPQKAYFFTFGYAFGSVAPFLDGYFKQRGMTDSQIRTMTGIRPFIGFLFIPLINITADHFQKRKIVLLVSLGALILMMSLLGLVPPPTEKSCEEILAHFGNKSNFSRSSHLGILGGGGGDGARKRSIDEHLLFKRQSDEYFPVDPNNQSDIIVLVDDLEGDIVEDRSWLYTESSLNALFAAYMSILIIGEIFTGPTGSLADTATLYSLGEERLTYYGIQRACAAIAHILSCFPAAAILKLSHMILLRCGISLDFLHYKILFFIFDGWMLLALLVVLFKFEYGDDKVHSTYNPKALLKMLKSPHYMSILAVAVFLGANNGLVHGFLFGYLRELGGDETVVGVATLILYGSEVLMFLLSHHFIRILGYMWVIYFGFGCYVVRFLMYALIINPWGLMPAEVLQGISYAAVWSSLTTYMAKGLTSDNYATVLGVLHAMYWGLGNGLGNLVGGVMIENTGIKQTFWAFCVMNVAILTLFAIVQRMFPSGPSLDEADYEELEGTKLVGDKQEPYYTLPPDNNFDNPIVTESNETKEAVESESDNKREEGDTEEEEEEPKDESAGGVQDDEVVKDAEEEEASV
ncbi:major facilitator superfamily domain-containing protein 6-like [Ptychodera flava]|uniref:major facilitator superfamily domain-containing protein 6-like n=1 Tax=Ptychodera flava TaxID=63121 RepID=UPI00396A3826